MPPGRPRTTCRGRGSGGVELRTWVSADERARVEARAKEAGVDLGDFVRDLALHGTLPRPQEWCRIHGATGRRLYEPAGCPTSVRVTPWGYGFKVEIGNVENVTECSSPMALAGVLTMEGVQPPTPEDLEWVRGGA